MCIKIWTGNWLYNVFLIQDLDVILTICHCNLNSVSAYSYSKLFLLKAYIAFHKFDIMCLSETYLDSNLQETADLITFTEEIRNGKNSFFVQ